MAGDNKQLSLSFKAAPLVLALSVQGPEVGVNITWPKSVKWAELSKDRRLSKPQREQLAWLKRGYEQLAKRKGYQHLAPHVLPLLAKVDIELTLEAEALETIAIRLGSLPLNYTQTVAASLADQLKLKRKSRLSVDALGALVSDRNPMRVISAQPINELQLGLDEYYRLSGLSWAGAHAAWQQEAYTTKVEFMRAGRPANFSGINYRVELVTEPGRLLAMVADGYWQIEAVQPAVPSHGFELPPQASDGGLMERCFDISAELFGQLQDQQPELAQLFVLWGHRQRAVVSVGQPHLVKLAEADNPFLVRLREKLSEKHPLLWEDLGKLGNQKRRVGGRRRSG